MAMRLNKKRICMHTNPFLLISELPAFFWQSRQFLILPVKVLIGIFPIKKV